MKPFLSESALESLEATAIALQLHYLERGDRIPLEALQNALIHWLEVSIEDLATDSLFHVLEGDIAATTNRSAFERALKKYAAKPLPQSYCDRSAISVAPKAAIIKAKRYALSL